MGPTSSSSTATATSSIGPVNVGVTFGPQGAGGSVGNSTSSSTSSIPTSLVIAGLGLLATLGFLHFNK